MRVKALVIHLMNACQCSKPYIQQPYFLMENTLDQIIFSAFMNDLLGTSVLIKPKHLVVI